MNMNISQPDPSSGAPNVRDAAARRMAAVKIERWRETRDLSTDDGLLDAVTETVIDHDNANVELSKALDANHSAGYAVSLLLLAFDQIIEAYHQRDTLSKREQMQLPWRMKEIALEAVTTWNDGAA